MFGNKTGVLTPTYLNKFFQRYLKVLDIRLYIYCTGAKCKCSKINAENKYHMQKYSLRRVVTKDKRASSHITASSIRQYQFSNELQTNFIFSKNFHFNFFSMFCLCAHTLDFVGHTDRTYGQDQLYSCASQLNSCASQLKMLRCNMDKIIFTPPHLLTRMYPQGQLSNEVQ